MSAAGPTARADDREARAPGDRSGHPADLAVLIEAIQDALPQTQCGQCGHKGCAPYAEAIARDGEAINRCPPGGADGIARLAELTGRDAIPLDPACGAELPRAVALIDEEACIGCTLCIKACPVDAIFGMHKRMHTVIPQFCTGCALCVPPCPVDCISMPQTLRDGQPVPPWTPANARAARQRFEARTLRLAREQEERERRLQARSSAAAAPRSTSDAAIDGAAPAAGAAPLADTLPPAPAGARPDASAALPAPQATGTASPADDRKRATVNAAIERARQKAALREAAARAMRDAG
ncbi:RnfABCDGE type electron transport complex subunit B [Derxia gummosa]|uniref:RnfABCDGE type electron transport complex subunit B n=1 Tax=Derxia gummosa DSM 723 TaxID=1121388 RepID=A0A8B6XB84_9BURK|nr:RnfABCDGE type electron transport complex subunit B [Derxia gummosa]